MKLEGNDKKKITHSMLFTPSPFLKRAIIISFIKGSLISFKKMRETKRILLILRILGKTKSKTTQQQLWVISCLHSLKGKNEKQTMIIMVVSSKWLKAFFLIWWEEMRLIVKIDISVLDWYFISVNPKG